jgi:hypothetical protein
VTGAGADLAVAGWRCGGCGLATVEPSLRCGECGARTAETTFGARGTVWSWTLAGVGPDRGVAFAYVDLDDGPRLLVRLADGTPRAVGARVSVRGTTPSGDLEAGA